MSLEYNKNLIPRAKELRKNAAPQENRLWYQFLRQYPIRFRRQKVIDNHIADFYCHKARLIIKLDGSRHFTTDGMTYDQARTAVLAGYNLRVIRFTNHQIDRELDGVCRAIDQAVTTP